MGGGVDASRVALRTGDTAGARRALEPPPPELQQLLGTMVGDQQAMDRFAGVVAGTVSPVDFFAPVTA